MKHVLLILITIGLTTYSNTLHAQQFKVFDVPPSHSIEGMFEVDAGGNRSGLEYDLIKKIAADNGWKIKWVMLTNVEADPRLGMLKQGWIDLTIYSVTITDERKKDVDFSVPYFESGTGIIVLKDSKITKLKDLSGKRIIAQERFTSYRAVKEFDNSIKVISNNDYSVIEEMLDDIVRGKLDGFANDYHYLQALVKKDPRFRLLKQPVNKEEFGIAIRKGLPNSVQEKINASINKLKKDGWFKKYAESESTK
ncbi:MAG: hypothetical protein COA78_27660 [Blastopirellula sp.]|nr:MAG: hypothetical protein COA78_27660 [Blastopirellula sp.]